MDLPSHCTDQVKVDSSHSSVFHLFPRMLITSATFSIRFPVLSTRQPSAVTLPSHGSKLKSTNLAAVVVLLFCVATLIPYQVAFVTTWLILLWTCASAPAQLTVAEPESSSSGVKEPFMDTLDIPLLPNAPDANLRSRSRSNSPTEVSSQGVPRADSSFRSSSPSARASLDASNLAKHVLLLQTLLVPLKAPVLAVWIRTLASAGYTTPFDGDHNILMVLPWLGLMEVVMEGTPWGTVRRR